MSIKIEQWLEVENDGIRRREFLRDVSFQDLVDMISEDLSAFQAAVDNLNAARKAFIDDCKQKDQAIDQERENLQKEVSDQETRIRTLSARYQKALGSGDTKSIPDLKKQIAAATAAKEEAAATLAALEGVTVEYNKKLFDAAERALEPVRSAKSDLRTAQRKIADMRDILEYIFRYDSDEYREIRNAGDLIDPDRYDPNSWSNWSAKFSSSTQDKGSQPVPVSSPYPVRHMQCD